MTYDEKGQTSSWKVEEYKSLGDKMAKAGLNTVLSMAIVFAVLIFIAIIIAQFKHIGNFQNGAKKEEVKAELKDGYLTVSAVKDLDEDEKDKETGKYIRRERYHQYWYFILKY